MQLCDRFCMQNIDHGKKCRNKYTFAAVTVSHLQIAIALHTSEVFCVIMIIYL